MDIIILPILLLSFATFISGEDDPYMIAKVHIKCNGTQCSEETVDNVAPPGFDDKTYGRTHRNDYHPYDRNGAYWLVPPFLIGASTVITIYIIIHCLYFHCYAAKKMKKLAEQSYPPAIFISDEQTSTGSYQAYSPIVIYDQNEGESKEMPSFFLYQPEEEQHSQRAGSIRSSLKSSIRSSLKRSTTGSKKSVTVQMSNLRPKNQRSVSESESSDQASGQDDARPKRVSICFVPVQRSLSVPASGSKKSRAMSIFQRTLSCKSKTADPKSTTKTNDVTSDNPSSSFHEAERQQPKTPVIIIRNLDSAKESNVFFFPSSPSPKDKETVELIKKGKEKVEVEETSESVLLNVEEEEDTELE